MSARLLALPQEGPSTHAAKGDLSPAPQQVPPQPQPQPAQPPLQPSSRNWDEEFQALLSGCCTSPQEALDLTTKINVLSQEFAAEATKIVTRIVASEAGSGGGGDAAEEMLGGITRLERRGVAGGCKYSASGMFFKLTTGDTVSYTYTHTSYTRGRL